MVTIEASTISGNSANGDFGGGFGNGGGIYNYGTVTMDDSVISGNSANGCGGGIVSVFGTATIEASTISGNSAYLGGGICSSTLTTLQNSIVARNAGGDGSGEFDSFGHNLVGNTEGTSGWVATDLLNVDPMLGPLQYNGGPTMTMALLPGSPAIDAGSNDLIPVGVMYDQRGPGFQRIVNGKVDIGAFEWQPHVSSFVASWGTQSSPLKLSADGLHLLPIGRKTDLPWSNINTLTITLSTAEALTSTNLTVTSATGVDYGAALNGSGTTYTISLAHPITNADRLTIKLNLAGVVTPTFELDVLPGDVNDDGVVTASDMVLVRNAFQKTGDPLMIGWCDLDGDGAITITDVTLARKKLGSRLP
jgi:hypothetical protein